MNLSHIDILEHSDTACCTDVITILDKANYTLFIIMITAMLPLYSDLALSMSRLAQSKERCTVQSPLCLSSSSSAEKGEVVAAQLHKTHLFSSVFACHLT